MKWFKPNTSTKSDRISAKLGRDFVTPKGDVYRLVSADIVPGYKQKRLFVYEWVNAPTKISSVVSVRLQSKSEVTTERIMNWILELKKY